MMEEKPIAPCGMNCGVCVSYLAMENDLKRKGFAENTVLVVCHAAKTVPLWQANVTYWVKGFCGSAMNARIFPADG